VARRDVARVAVVALLAVAGCGDQTASVNPKTR
jgi:hypothetical protein